MSRIVKCTAILLALCSVSLIPIRQTQAASLGGEVLKGAAIGFAVTKAAEPLDKFINTVTLRHGMGSQMGTKVVPILSVGEKGYVGGAQVSGPASEVAKVQAVFQYEKQFSNNNYRAKVLLASASLNPLKLERVAKVGVTAIIDVSLDGRQRFQTVGTGIQTGDVIRGAAVLVAVKNAAPGINDFLNKITFNSSPDYTTKVVPMGSFGEKMYLGAAQVSAATKSIPEVNALWQYEDTFSGGQFRVKVMIPTTSADPFKMRRVDGAGLTAVVDMALSEQKEVKPESKKTTNLKDIIRLPGGKDEKSSREKGDNGLHRGWEIGQHNGWDKDNKDNKKSKSPKKGK